MQSVGEFDSPAQYMTEKAEKSAKVRAAKRISDNPDDPRHGTLNGYTTYACRCDLCREANSLYYRRRNGGSPPKNATPKYGVKPSGNNRTPGGQTNAPYMFKKLFFEE